MTVMTAATVLPVAGSGRRGPSGVVVRPSAAGPRRVGAVMIPRPATHSLPMRAAKVGADLALWGRVGARRRVEHALTPAAVRPLPEGIPGTAVLHSTAEVDAAVEQARRLRLPLHPTRAKNWDVLGAVRAVLEHVGPGRPGARRGRRALLHRCCPRCGCTA